MIIESKDVEEDEVEEQTEEKLIDPDFAVYQNNINNEPDHIIRYCLH